MDFHIDQSRLSWWLALINLNLSQGIIYFHTVRHLNYVYPQQQCQNLCYLFSEQEGKTNDIQELRNRIMEVLRQEPYMGEKIPVR